MGNLRIKCGYMVLALLACACAFPASAGEALGALREAVREVQAQTDTPALAVVLVDRGELVWLEARGLADIEGQVAATPDTLFRIGSTSKMLVGLAVLKLVEEGRLDLDGRLRDLAPEIAFVNRWEDEHPVRLVHLLEHTSGWDDLRLVEYAHNEASPIALEQALVRHPGARTSRWVPGTRMAYSNAGPAVAAYIVEKVAGVRFEVYVDRTFFKPLRMDSATYFQPDRPGQQLATGYMQGQAQPYWHMMHRPAGAVNASARDMANMLRFFLGSGEIHGTRVLGGASIDRMEAATTTLGAREGITAGYGLANHPSGHADFGVAFRGHGGGLPGATAELAYLRATGSGYVVMATGDGAAVGAIADLLKAHLLRDAARPAISPGPLPASFAAASGIYVPVNPRSTRDGFLPVILGAMEFTGSDTYLHRMPVLGGWAGPSSDYAVSDNLLVDQWNGLPTVAHVRDPLVGDAIQVGPDLFVRSSPVRVWGEVVLLAALLASSGFAVVLAVAWLPFAVRGRRTRSPEARLMFWPVCASILLGLAASRVELSMARMDMAALGSISPQSMTIFALTLGYGVAAVLGCVAVVRLRNNGARRQVRWLAALLALLHLLMVLHLASHGMIGLRTWTT